MFKWVLCNMLGLLDADVYVPVHYLGVNIYESALKSNLKRREKASEYWMQHL